MRTIKITDLVTMTLKRTEDVLFRPFNLKKWFRFAFIAFFAASLMGGINFFSSYNPASTQKIVDNLTHHHNSSVLTTTSRERSQHIRASIKSAMERLGPSFIWIVVCSAIGLIAICLFMTWISARFEFIFFHVLVHGDASIRQLFDRYKPQGNSLFKFYFLNLLGIFAVIFLFIFMMILMFAQFKTNLVTGITIVLGIVALIVALLYWSLIIVGLYVRQIIVPIMAIDNCSFELAWSKFWTIYKANSKDFGAYILSVIAMALSFGFILGIIVLVLVIGVILSGVCIVFMGIAIGHASPTLVPVLIGIGIAIAIVYVVALFVGTCLLYLPSTVFFRSFNLYFLSSLNAGYTPLPLVIQEPKGTL